MPNLNEIEEPQGADYATHWAVMREYEMRYRRYSLAQRGVVHYIGEMAKAARRFNETLMGIEGSVHVKV